LASDLEQHEVVRRLIVVTLDPAPEARLIDWPTTRVQIGPDSFTATASTDSNGFYDFLRSAENRIVGVRFMPFVEHVNLLDATRTSPRLRIIGTSPHRALELFWTNDTSFDRSLSDDQLLDWNFVLKSASGKDAVTFDFSGLSLAEQEDLQSRIVGEPV
jgi:hypothetical protein